MHEMKTRGRVSLIAVVAAAALAITACSPSAAVPNVSDTASGGLSSGAAGGSAVPIVSPSVVNAAMSALNGTYRWTMTKEDALAYAPAEDTTPAALAQLPRVGTRILEDGMWVGDPGFQFGDSGTYTVEGNRVTFRSVDGSLKTFTFSVDAKGDLTVTPVQPMSAEDAYIWSTEVWTKIK
jgi:hypothetical protein